MHHRLPLALRLIAAALFQVSSFSFPVSAQRPPAQPHAAEILHRMQKLNVLGSVLYIVAHPDDENTRLIAWLANGKKVRTGNLSLTRGDGGQNLIGPELGDALGIIRTQELLEARRIDGGEQFFTRAVDFGYSKTAEESFEKWGKQEVLSDVVRVIRMFRPDIIISRFSTEPGTTHGHHTASAILAHEAFDLAGDLKAFPEHLEQGLEVWQPRRLFFNGSSWWRRDLSEVAKNDPDWFTVDVGGYDPLLGLSYTEIAGRSRSMHKSQGFGAAETRGESLEYLKLEKGDRPKGKDIFEGIDMTWGRVKELREVQKLVDKMVRDYDVTAPHKSLALLEEIDKVLYMKGWHYTGDTSTISSSKWASYMSSRILTPLVHAVIGYAGEVLAERHHFSIGDSIDLNIVSLIRSSVSMSKSYYYDRPGQVLSGAYITPLAQSISSRTILAEGRIDQPYWLESPHDGLHAVEAQHVGRPSLDPEVQIGLSVQAETGLKRSHSQRTSIMHKWVDRVAGERIRPVYITPVASVIPKTDVLIARGGPQTITVEVEALTDSLTGQLNVTLPEGWATSKDLKLVDIAKRNERQSFTYQLIPMDHAKGGAVKFEFTGPKGTADRTLHEIDYPHIMPQVYYTPAEVKLVPLDVTTTAKRVGYIKGAGDEVPKAIEQLGATMDFIEPATATLESISKYDAIVVGIRAYNNNQGMKRFNPVLMKYAENGGTVVAQYTTRTNDMVLPDSLIGPYPFKLTRGRVTVEEAPPVFLDPKHPLLNTPNKITAADFEGWVQERGLYFAGGFEKHYTPLIAWNDPGEEPLNGALIVADHGKGRFIYTGISFFRQLPAGVGGAYRLWGNLISPREVRGMKNVE